ncbi:MAG: DUF547 domain-containing protein [Erythrobacter sp.]
MAVLAVGVFTTGLAAHAPLHAHSQQPNPGDLPVLKAVAQDADRFSIFRPTGDRIDHTIDYSIWDFALKQLVVSMGPSTRQRPVILDAGVGTRLRLGHNSRFRVEGSMVFFSQLDQRAIDSFREYREDLERVAGTLDIASLPRNEQLAFWFNLHNVALMEQIAKAWPIRQPRTLEIGGAPLDEARVITIRGISMSLRDIRENIVFANWRDPRVIYGFWRGELGGPSLDREAFTGQNVDGLLTTRAQEYVSSLRGTEKRGRTLHVSTLYDETRRFYFPNFEADVRAHISEFASDEVLELVGKTESVEATIREWDIADLSGGRRDSIAQINARPGLPAGAAEILRQRAVKLDRMRRKDQPTGRVIFSPLIFPGDDPDKGVVD